MSHNKSLMSKDDLILNSILDIYKSKFKTEIQLTEEEKNDLIEYASKIRFGSTAWIPMICLGAAECVYRNTCPIIAKSPIGKKCVSGDTILMTSEGDKEIQFISENELVLSCDNNHKKSYNRIIKKKEIGEKDVYKIITLHGLNIKCTRDHEIYTIKEGKHERKGITKKSVRNSRGIDKLKHEWISIDTGLSVGHKIAILQENIKFGNDKLAEGVAEFLGYYLTDGYSSSGQIVFTNTNHAMVSDFIRICQQLKTKCGFTERRRENKKIYWDVRPTNGRTEINPIKDLLKFYNLYTKKGKEKFIPDIFFSCEKNYICKLLNRLWSGDGCVSIFNKRDKKSVMLTFASESYLMITQVCELLKKLGIYTTINKKSDKEFWIIQTSSVDNVKKFFDNVGIIYGKETQCYKALEVIKTTSNRCNSIENDIRWDYIKSIVKIGIEKVYDIEVENNHNFFANYILVHNCPFEEYAAKAWYEDYVTSLQIDDTDKIERSQILELVESDIINARANAVLGTEGLIMTNPIGIDQDTGNPIYRKEEHLAMKIKGRVQARRDRILKAFVATRESKIKATKGVIEDATVYMARLRALAIKQQQVHDMAVVVETKNEEIKPEENIGSYSTLKETKRIMGDTF